MKKKLAIAVLVTFLTSWSSSGVAEASPGGNENLPSSDRGMRIFQAFCAGCHGFNGRGDGPMAASLGREYGVRPSDLIGPEMKKKSDSELETAVVKGGQAVHKTSLMPAWGDNLNSKQLGDLVAYLRALQSDTEPPQASMAVFGEHLELGRVLYTVYCLACHGEEAQGDGLFYQGLNFGETGVRAHRPRDLTKQDLFRHKTDAYLSDLIKMSPHHSGVPEKSLGRRHRDLSQKELDTLILYLRTLRLKNQTKPG